jgi:transposase
VWKKPIFATFTILGKKGLNENTNRLIQPYFSKQTNFRNTSDREIRRVQDESNHRPRKTLGYKTPSVLFLNLFLMLYLKSESNNLSS